MPFKMKKAPAIKVTVPVLGRIPVLGNLFRSRKTDKVKTNLLIFLRPKILRTASQTATETNAKYNYIRDVLEGSRGAGVQLMPDEERPTVPPLDLTKLREDDSGEDEPAENEPDDE